MFTVFQLIQSIEQGMRPEIPSSWEDLYRYAHVPRALEKNRKKNKIQNLISKINNFKVSCRGLLEPRPQTSAGVSRDCRNFRKRRDAVDLGCQR